MCTTRLSPGAAKFLLNWPTTDLNILSRSGESFLVKVRWAIEAFCMSIAKYGAYNPDHVQYKFQLQHWRGIDEMLVERGAHESGITAIG
jgi:hypothetical protein